MAVSADLLVRIAAPAYADAAPLIAPVGLGFVAYGLFIVLVRTAQIQRRTLVYSGMSAVCAVLFVLLAMLMIPWLGPYGAALSVVLAMLFGCLVLVILIGRGDEPVPFESRRMGGAFALALAAYATIRWVAPTVGAWSSVVEAATFVAFVALLVACGVVPFAHVRPLARIARSLAPTRGQRRGLTDGVATLEAGAQICMVLQAVARDGLSAERAASMLRLAPEQVSERLVGALRRLRDRDHTTDHDAAIGAALLSTAAPAERDAEVRRLWDERVDPMDLHDLEVTLERLRAAPKRKWPPSAPVNPPVTAGLN